MDKNALPGATVQDTFQNDRRTHLRHTGKAAVTIYRDCDRIRAGLPVKLHDLSTHGVSIVSSVQMHDGEQIKIKLQNHVQRFVRDYRGIVRWQSPVPDGTFRIGIELLTSMTPFDMMSLKRAGFQDLPEDRKVWM